MPDEGAEAMFICGVAERFGQPPHSVLEWPATTLRLLEIDHLMRKAKKKDG